MYSKLEAAKRDEFLDRAKAARLDRATDKQRDSSAIIVQVSATYDWGNSEPKYEIDLQNKNCILYTYCIATDFNTSIAICHRFRRQRKIFIILVWLHFLLIYYYGFGQERSLNLSTSLIPATANLLQWPVI